MVFNIYIIVMRKILFFGFVLIISCNTQNKHKAIENDVANQVKYAKGFSIFNHGDYYTVEVYNPWDNYQVLARYNFPDSLSSLAGKDGICIKTPIKRGVFLSSTYIAMLSVLNSVDIIKGCTNANWIYDSVVYQKYLHGEIANLGDGLNFDAESIIAQSPDIVMKYIYKSPDQIDDILKNAGVPIVYNIEFMEKDPLGRAEWIKLMGLLTGKEEKADSVFNSIVKNYKRYCLLAKQAANKPTVLVGNTYKGVWYAVGGNSFVAKLISDANASYYWKNDSTAGNLPLSFEAVLQKQKDDEYWIDANASSLSEILNVEPRCNQFKAFQTGKVYHYNKRINPEGGLDYYESGVIRPDLLLRDLLIILHPGLLDSTSQTTYWQKLN